MNVLISINSKYIVPASVLIFSLCKYNEKEKIDLYIAYHDLEEKDFERIEKILNYFKNKRLVKVNVGLEFSKKVKADRFSHESYYRVLALDMLPESIDRIMYLDSDMIVKGSLNDVYYSDFKSNCPFKVCEDISAYRDNAFSIAKNRVQIPSNYKYFNSGFLLINMDYIRSHNVVSYVTDAFYRDYEKYPYHDQDILNHMYYDKVEYVPWSLYNLIPGYWFLDSKEFSKGNIRFATYQEINSGNVMGNSQFVDLSKQLMDNAVIIHFLWILRPWIYEKDAIYKDIVPFTDLWFNIEEEMYKRIETLERLSFAK